MTALQLLAARVPRYTSYPTAPHFSHAVQGPLYQSWLETLPAQTPISLYLHIPFCDTLCWFCACHTTVVNNYAPVEEYCRLLQSEIEAVATLIGRRQPVTHIHWGGGSPTLLDGADMRRLTALLHERFDVAPTAEIAVEIDPRGFDARLAKTLADCGVTRASIGLQDCDPKVQRAINRIQTDDELRNAVSLLRRNGIGRINLDLVYGLPYQTSTGLDRNIDIALALEPSRVALFGYAHVPSFKKHQALIPEEALPDTEARFALAQLAEKRLLAAGFEPVGLDHFARPDDDMAIAARTGTLRRNFQGYTSDSARTLIGFGASAISMLPQGYAQNSTTVANYREALEAGFLPISKGFVLGPEDRLRRHVIEQIMCFLKVDLAACCTAYDLPINALDWALPALAPLCGAGAVSINGRTILVNTRMRAASRLACAVFDAYLETGKARHSLSA